MQVISEQQFWNSCSTDNKNDIINTIWEARKASTVEKYCFAIRRFKNYCSENQIPLILPIDSLTIANYLVYISKTYGTKGATNDAVCGLKWLNTFIPGLNSQNDPMKEEFLSRISQSCNRDLAKMKIRKKPLTDEILKLIIKNFLELKKPSLLQLRNTLIPCLAYSLLLRHDEISHINMLHISKTDLGLKILIPSSKTDTFRQGKYVFLSKEISDVYNLFFRYTKMAQLGYTKNHFLFCPIVFSPKSKKFSLKNAKLSYDVYRNIVKEAVSSLGIDPTEYSTHSCRSGGATALADKVTQFELMLTGRWSDPRSIGSYVETSDEKRFEISSYLGFNN